MSALSALIWNTIFSSKTAKTASEAVLFTPMDLSADEKTQARANIGAGNPATGIPEDFAQDLLTALRAGAFASANGAALVQAIEDDLASSE